MELSEENQHNTHPKNNNINKNNINNQKHQVSKKTICIQNNVQTQEAHPSYLTKLIIIVLTIGGLCIASVAYSVTVLNNSQKKITKIDEFSKIIERVRSYKVGGYVVGTVRCLGVEGVLWVDMRLFGSSICVDSVSF